MIDRIRFLWHCPPRLVDKVSVIIFMLFPPMEMMRIAYPNSTGWLIPINYVHRWIKLGRVLLFNSNEGRVDIK